MCDVQNTMPINHSPNVSVFMAKGVVGDTSLASTHETVLRFLVALSGTGPVLPNSLIGHDCHNWASNSGKVRRLS